MHRLPTTGLAAPRNWVRNADSRYHIPFDHVSADSVGSPGSCLTKKQTEFHLPETVADEVRLPNLLDGGSDAESVCSAPQNAIVNSRGSVSAAESAGGQHTGSQMFVDTVDNEFEFEKEPTSSNDASLANAGLPAQRTDNNVEGPILCDKTTGKRRTTDSGAVAGEAGVIGVRESSGNAETAVPPNGAFFNRVGQSRQLFNLTDLLFRRKCMIMIGQICAMMTKAKARRLLITSN